MLKAFFIDSSQADYTSEEFSWFQKFWLEEGVFGDSVGTLGLQASQSTPQGMSLSVAAGNALVEITKDSKTWKVIVMSDAAVTKIIGANTSGANRVDAVILRVDKDTEPNALKTNIATIEVITGTGTTALSDAAIDAAVAGDGWIRLADVTVPSAASQISDSDIADARARVLSNEAVRFSPKTLEFRAYTEDPTGSDLKQGLVWFNSTDQKLKYYDGVAVIPMETSTYTAGYGIKIQNGEISASIPAGSVTIFAGAAAPAGWLLCDGASLLRSAYPDLFAIIGTTYGSADGTHFSLPNLKGRVPVGLSASDTEFDALGETGGEKTHTLLVAELPAHTHTFGSAGGGSVGLQSNIGAGTPVASSSVGSGTAHNNLQPYIVLNYIIKT